MDLSTPVLKVDGTSVPIEDLDRTFDMWVHTGRNITVTKCAPNSDVAITKLRNPNVYPITRHVRGKVLLISNTGYQALRLLKDLFEQLQYKITIYTEKTSQEIFGIIQREALQQDNATIDSFIVIIYGAPDDVDYRRLPDILNPQHSPSLTGKPKLIYVIGNDLIVQQVGEVANVNSDPDYLLASTGFNGVMFYIYVLCSFVHELSATDIWKLLSQFADRHRFSAASHSTLTKEFYFFPGLTSTGMPNEIQNMDPADVELYLQMLETSRMSVYHLRLMFVGLYGAGKTSTARRIMGRDIDDVTSTDGIDVYIGKCRVRIRDGTWTTLEDTQTNMPYEKLSHILLTDEESASRVPDIKNLEYRDEAAIHLLPGDDVDVGATVGLQGMGMKYGHLEAGEQQAQQVTKKRRKAGDMAISSPQERDSEAMDVDPSGAKSPSSTSSMMSSLSDFEMVEAFGTTSESMSIAQRVIHSKAMNTGSVQKEAHVSLWDFAGQFVYYATHQLFFSPRAIYLLVLNMEEDLDKTLTEDWYQDLRGIESIERQGGVMFWLRSICTYAKGSQPGIPPIVLVGTHKDKLQGDEKQQRKTADDYFKRIRNAFQGTPVAYNIHKDTFLLNNNMARDEELDRLKQAVLDISKTMPFWGEPIPARWVELEQALEDRRLDGRPFINMRELVDIDKGLAKPIREDDQLRLFLRFHHETGTLIYFDDAKHLRDLIVLDPQWIIHAFRYLISAEEFGRKYGEMENAWRDFMQSGQLKMELAIEVWKQDPVHHFFENHEKLLHFLEKLDIIARASTVRDDGQTLQQLPFYYVPCLLKRSPETDLLKMPNKAYCVSTPVLILAFKGDFLPPAVFNRLMAVCLGKWPVAKQGKRNLIFCGCAVFMVSHGKEQDKHRMTIFFRKSKIGIRITRYSSRGARIVDTAICDKVRRIVSASVRREFNRFQAREAAALEPFGYLLQCRDTAEGDYLDEGLLDVENLVDSIDSDYFCEEHTDQYEPHAVSAVEMLQEWFPDKIPPNFRLDSKTTVDTWLERLSDTVKSEKLADATLSKMTRAIGKNWNFLMLELNVSEVFIQQTDENYPRNVKQRIYHCLREWKYHVLHETSMATNAALIDAMKTAEQDCDVTIEWELVQNIIEGIE